MPRIASAERREQLVRAALRVIARSGVAAATTRAVVAEAGMSLASFHYAFRSHDEMMGQLVSTVVAAQRDVAAAALGPDLRASIRAALGVYLDLLIADPVQEQALLEIMQYAMRTPGLEPLVREQWASYRAAAESLAVEAAAAAGVQWRVPVADVARLVITITDGVTLAWLADRDAAAAATTLDLAAHAIDALAAAPAAEAAPPASTGAPT
jgi:AcrR family transcriptional regulator